MISIKKILFYIQCFLLFLDTPVHHLQTRQLATDDAMKIIHISLCFSLICNIIYAKATTPSDQSISTNTAFLPKNHDYEILSRETVYNRWRSIIQQRVKMPNGNLVDYDVSLPPLSEIILLPKKQYTCRLCPTTNIKSKCFVLSFS